MLIRHGLIYVSSNVVTGAFSLATTVVLTKLLSPASYGVYGLAFAVISLAYASLFDWHGMSFLRFCDNDGKREEAVTTFVYIFAALVLAAAGAFAFVYLVGIASAYDSILWIGLLGTCAMAWFQFVLRVQMADLHPERAFWMNLIRVAVTLGLSIAAAYFTKSAIYVLLAAVAGQLAGSGVYPLRGVSVSFARFNRRLARMAFNFGYPLAISATLGSISLAIGRFMLAQLASIEAVGRFTAANLIIHNVLLLLATGVGQATYPLALKSFETGDPASLQRQLTHNFAILFGMLLPAAVGLSLVAPNLSQLVVGRDFVDEVTILTPWMAAAAVLSCVRAQYVDFLFHLGRKTGYLVGILAMTTALYVGLNVLLIPPYKEEGAAMALVFALVPPLILALVLSSRAVHVRFPFKVAGQIILACLAMALSLAVTLHFRGPAGLVAQIVVGTVTYATALAAVDLMGIRRQMLQRIAQAWRRRQRMAPQPVPLKVTLGSDDLLSQQRASSFSHQPQQSRRVIR